MNTEGSVSSWIKNDRMIKKGELNCKHFPAWCPITLRVGLIIYHDRPVCSIFIKTQPTKVLVVVLSISEYTNVKKVFFLNSEYGKCRDMT